MYVVTSKIDNFERPWDSNLDFCMRYGIVRLDSSFPDLTGMDIVIHVLWEFAYEGTCLTIPSREDSKS